MRPLRLPLPALRLLGNLLPPGRAPRSRTALLRAAGFTIAPTTAFLDLPTFIGPRWVSLWQQLVVGEHCFVNHGCLFDLGAPITIADHVYVAHRVMIITSSHGMGPHWQRAGDVEPRPVAIEQGAWLGAGTIVLPGMTVGAGAVVAAGSVVNRDVAPNTLVAGVPAKSIRQLPTGEQAPIGLDTDSLGAP